MGRRRGNGRAQKMVVCVQPAQAGSANGSPRIVCRGFCRGQARLRAGKAEGPCACRGRHVVPARRANLGGAQMTWQPDLWSYNPRDARRSVRATNVAEADETEERNSKPTQAGRILAHLRAGNRLTAARIHELRREGWNVQERTVETRSGKRVAEYWLWDASVPVEEAV
ncbi:MAG: hypothetical protein EBR82_81780 [Caulobacteraceae bacterium]|nr:hypothetical protein [Caulobacteraceae bacterium]